MKAAIMGTGVVGGFGCALSDLARAVEPVLAGSRESHVRDKATTPLAADTSVLESFVPKRALRRVDHFTRMVLLAAFLALEDAKDISGQDPRPLDEQRTGIILATGYGPARTTFEFLDSMLDYGPECASPTAFSHSVHNIPAATLAMFLKLNGPCATICQGTTAMSSALLTARIWLAEGRVDTVLLAAVDELSPMLSHCVRQMTREESARNGKDSRPLGEGAVCFVLAGSSAESVPRTFIEKAEMPHNVSRGDTHGPCAIFTPLATDRFARMFPTASPRCPVLDCSAAYGRMPVGMAFDMAVADLVLARGLEAGFSQRECGRIHCLDGDFHGMNALVVLAEGGEGR